MAPDLERAQVSSTNSPRNSSMMSIPGTAHRPSSHRKDEWDDNTVGFT
ncbi:hypothetical protein [Streptomyces youssoufiensis]